MNRSVLHALLLFLLGLSLAWGQTETPTVDDSSEAPLTQPEDPTEGDPRPDALGDETPEEETTPSESTEEEGTPTEEEETQEDDSDSGAIKFDPSKTVVKPAKVKEDPKPTAVPPPPKHSANPEADLFEHAELVAKYELWPQAERQYRVYVETYPNKPNAQAAYYGLAEARLKLGKVAEAEATYRALLRKFSRGEHVGAAAYRLANMHYRRQEFKEAVTFFEQASRLASKDLVRKSAAFFRGRCLQELGSTRTAEPIFKKLAYDVNDHQYRDASALILARMNVDRGQHQNAYDLFIKLAEPPTAPNIRAEAITKAGLMAAKLGKRDEAQKYYEQVLDVDTKDARPWHPKAFWGLLHLFYEQGKYQDLIDQYQRRSITYNQADTDRSQAPVMIMVAHAFRRLEKYRQAASLYDRAVRLAPEAPESREAGYRHLYCLYKDDSPFLIAKTQDYLNRQRKLGSDHQYYHLALLLKAEKLFGQKQKTSKTYAEAAEAYDAIELSKVPEKYHPLITYKSGWAHVEAESYDKGVTAFTEFLLKYRETHPELVPKILAKRGEAYRKVRHYPNALRDFNELISMESSDDLTYLAMQQKALMQVERENRKETITAFQELLERFPNGQGSAEAHYFIGDAHYRMAEFEDSIAPLKKARDLNKEVYVEPATQRVIIAHWRLGNLDGAAEEVDLLLAHDPKTNLIPPKLWLWLGTRSFQQDRFEAAARYLRQVANPDKPTETWPLAWSFLGRAYLQSGKYEESIAPFDHYLASDPAPDERARALLHKATSLSQTGKLKEARATAEEVHRILQQGRTYGQAWILLGDIAMAQKDFEEASKYYVVPSRLFKDPLVTPVALEKAAIAFEKLGESQRGADLRRQLRDEWPSYQSGKTEG